jgi:hypothetical protein
MENPLDDELRYLKAERAVLIRQLCELDERITQLAKEVQKNRSREFLQKHRLSLNLGDVVQLDDTIREFALSLFTEVLNPLLFTESEAKVIGYDYDNDAIFLGKDMEDPAPIPVPIALLVKL